MTARYAKIAMTACLAFFACLVALTNITDYGGNQPFVQHVLSMDTTFRGPDVAYRAIDAPWLWTLGYLAIIAGEVLTAGLMAWAALRMFRARNASARGFDASKSLVHLAALSGFLVWFLGFMAIGGEWFLMWQSKTWNGQEAAFRFYVSILLVLIYVNQPEAEIATPADRDPETRQGDGS
jgi:predicted small integral membrane protein